MKSGKWAVIGTGLLAAVLLRAEMQEWLQHLPSGDWLKVFFHSVTLAGGAVDVRRPPSETRPALTQLITAIRRSGAVPAACTEAELQLDFAAAEADWRHYVQLAQDQGAAWLELADYFDRRHQPGRKLRHCESSGGWHRIGSRRWLRRGRGWRFRERYE